MAKFNDAALMILRYMFENGYFSANSITRSELRSHTVLDEDIFDSADSFLLESAYVKGTMGWDDALRWLMVSGVEKAKEEMRKRENISLDAERVLVFAVANTKDVPFVVKNQVLTKFNITDEHYREIFQELEDLGFIDESSDYEKNVFQPTKSGRLAVRNNFEKAETTPNLQVGFINNGTMNGSNIQAIASAQYSEIQQNVSTLSTEELHKEIEQTLEKLLGQVTDQLSIQQKADYTKLIADFQQETARHQPDPGKLHKLLAGIGFLSDIGGAIDISQKTFELVVKASPYIMLLGQMAMQLLQNSAR